jgi:hypothetical protein
MIAPSRLRLTREETKLLSVLPLCLTEEDREGRALWRHEVRFSPACKEEHQDWRGLLAMIDA